MTRRNRPWWRWRFSLGALTLVIVLGDAAWLLLMFGGPPRTLCAVLCLGAVVYVAQREWRRRNDIPPAPRRPVPSRPWYLWSFELGAVVVLAFLGYMAWSALVIIKPLWLRAVVAAPFAVLFVYIAAGQWHRRRGRR